MRVALMGQAAFGEAVFKRLRDDGVDVIAVSAPAPSAGGRPDPLWAAAVEGGLAPVDTACLKSEPGIGHWRAIGADLAVMAFVTEILPGELLAAPRLGSIQYHPSLLPAHRGSSAMNWAIINGDRESGLSIFWPDRGIDTGPILLQERCEILADDTVGSLYFQRLFPMGVEALSRSVALVAAGKAGRHEQDHALATYEPPIVDAHAAIEWHAPAERIYALIRGSNPQPGAWTTYEQEKLRIFDCRLLGAPEPGMPGRVLRVGDEGVDVRLNGDVLRVQRVMPAGGKKVPAAEWAASVSLEPGHRFRS